MGRDTFDIIENNMANTLKNLISGYNLGVTYAPISFSEEEIKKFYNVLHTASPMFFNNITSVEQNLVADLVISLLNKISKACNSCVLYAESFSELSSIVEKHTKLRWACTINTKNIIFEDFCFLKEQKLQNVVFFILKKLKNSKLLVELCVLLLILAINDAEELANAKYLLMKHNDNIILITESTKNQFNYIKDNFLIDKVSSSDIFVKNHNIGLYDIKNDKECFKLFVNCDGLDKFLKKINILDAQNKTQCVSKYVNLTFEIMLKKYRIVYKDLACKINFAVNKDEALRYIRYILKNSLTKTLAAKFKITAKQACQKYNVKKIIEDQWRA